MASSWSAPGRPVEATFHIQNRGNVPLEIPPTIGAPYEWRSDWIGPNATLAPGESLLQTLRLAAPMNTSAGIYDLHLDAVWAQSDPIQWEIRTVLLSLRLVTSGSSAGIVEVIITNNGTGDAYGVPVDLITMDKTVDHVVLQRIPAGGQVTATLSLGSNSGPASVIVDPQSLYSVDPLWADVHGSTEGRPIAAPTGMASALAILAAALFLIGRRT
jgi:hypothetical protein